MAAARLQAGDTLLATADRRLTVTSVEARHERTWVYNLTVAGTHTYTVGTAGVVTHNQGEPNCAVGKIGNAADAEKELKGAGVDIEKLKKEQFGDAGGSWNVRLDAEGNIRAKHKDGHYSPDSLRKAEEVKRDPYYQKVKD